MDKIRIMLADDHAVLREGMRNLLQQEGDFDVVGEASNGEEAVDLATRLNPDVALMDIVMPKLNGIDATIQIRQASPSTAVLVLTAYDDDSYVLGLLQAGAAGYLLKSSRGRELVEAIRTVHAGESVLHPDITRRLLKRAARRGTSSSTERPVSEAEDLTEREMEVLKLAAKGLSNREIARQLVLSVRTVKAHLSNIFNKMKVGSRTEAVLSAVRSGWITLEDIP